MSSNAEYDEYVAWLKANGATFDAILWPHETPNTGRGAVLTRSIKAGESFLSVPSQLIINGPRCCSDPDIGPLLSTHQLFLDSEELTLAMYVAFEKLKGRNSFWFPYISTLPKDTGSLGRTWTPEELAELQDDQFVFEVSEMIPQERKQQYAQVMNVLLGTTTCNPLNKDTLTYDLFAWSMEIVSSRVFGRRINFMSLVPLADNLNHSNVGVKYAIHAEDGRFRLFPTVDISVPKGKVVEAFNSYGRRSNANLLLGYGFALQDNEWDDVQLDLQLPPMVSAEKKRAFDFPGPFITQFRVGTIPHSFLRFFRLVYAPKQDVAMQATFSQGGYQFITCDIERAVVRTCKRELETLLTSFPTTEEEDLELLQQNGENIKFVFALRYRIGRKRAVFFNLKLLVRLEAWLAANAQFTYDTYLFASEQILQKMMEEHRVDIAQL